jgi:hypothetical protein
MVKPPRMVRSCLAVTNPFPGEAIRLFLAKAGAWDSYPFALCNAQRTVIVADDAVDGLVEMDRRIVDSTLESCWAAADAKPLAFRLSARCHREPLIHRPAIKPSRIALYFGMFAGSVGWSPSLYRRKIVPFT